MHRSCTNRSNLTVLRVLARSLKQCWVCQGSECRGAVGTFAGKWGGTSSRSIWGGRSTALIPLMYQPSYKIYANDKAWKTLCTSHQHLYLVLVLIVELIRRIRRSGFYPLSLEVVCTTYLFIYFPVGIHELYYWRQLYLFMTFRAGCFLLAFEILIHWIISEESAGKKQYVCLHTIVFDWKCFVWAALHGELQKLQKVGWKTDSVMFSNLFKRSAFHSVPLQNATLVEGSSF